MLHRLAIVAACVLALALSACNPGPAAERLATGHVVVTDEPRYDQFFLRLSQAAERMGRNEREQREARGALSRRLGIEGEATAEDLRERLRERVLDLRGDGLTLQLEFSGIDDEEIEAAPESDPAAANGDAAAGEGDGDGSEAARGASLATATLTTPGRAPQPRELRLLKPLAQAALTSATLYVSSHHGLRDLAALEEQRARLATEVEAAFEERARRRRVSDRLEEARQLIDEIQQRTSVVMHASDVMIAVLDEAANAAGGPPPRRRATRPRPRKPSSRGTRARRPRKQREPRRSAAPAERPAPTGDAFEP